MDDSLPKPELSQLPRSLARSIFGAILWQCLFLLVAAGLFLAHEHFKLRGQSTPSTVSLLAAAGFALAPVRALMRELFDIESKFLCLLHEVGGLALADLSLGGIISGAPLLNHAALAPFAIMGAAQALMHQNHPRNTEQAGALRRFAASLPQFVQIADARDFTSLERVARAISVLTDLTARAQALGETELRSGPEFQSAIGRMTLRFGLFLVLDSADETIAKLNTIPGVAAAQPALHVRLDVARRAMKTS